jgi:polyisoprenoid-binding protein YceI
MNSSAALTAATIQPGHYDIDPGRSAVTFRTRHLFGLAPVRGTFAIRRGAVDIDPARPSGDSGIYAEIDTASFHTSNPIRNQAVLSRRLLDARTYPVITFSSTQLDQAAGVIEGNLTVQGTARPVRLSVTSAVTSGPSLTATAVTRVDRYEFGIARARGLAGRYLTLTVTVECAHRAEGRGHG